MTDTVRSVTDLLDALFASNQAPRSITEQDMRDAIVSISLETADFSDLPRSSVDLPIGRCWIAPDFALRVVTSLNLGLVSAAGLAGGGGLFAQGVRGGVSNAWPAAATLGGIGGVRATPIQVFAQSARATLGGAGSLAGLPMQRLLGRGTLGGSGLFIANPTSATTAASSPFSADFSSAFGSGPSGSISQAANSTIAGRGTLFANPLRGGTTAWDPTKKSIYITLSNSNRTATKTGFDGWYGGVVTTSFKSSGKWYWEFVIGAKAGDTGLGLANPSWAVDNGDPTLGSYLGTADGSVGLYNGGSSGYYNDGPSGAVGPMPNVVAGGNVGFALDCDNWKWWARQDGGAWNVGQAGAQDPATNQGGIPIGASYRVGGMAPAVTLQGLNDSVTGVFSAPWSFVPPPGFSAP